MKVKNSQITVRNVEPMLKQRIAQLAKLKSKSINDLVLDTMRVKVGLKSESKKTNWSKYQGMFKDDAFDDAVFEDFEKIDESMWR